jgi:recombination protein RecR
MSTVDPIKRLILAFSRLPTIGEKTASRLAFFLLNRDPEIAQDLSFALANLHTAVEFCKMCAHVSAQNPCEYCNDPKRNQAHICVVEDLSALMAIEKTGEHRGVYHVLHGVIAPLDGIGPEDLKITLLLHRLQNLLGHYSSSDIEIILATNPSVDGEATALYLQRLLKGSQVKISRIASGIPIGSHLQYADQLSLAQALLSRRILS